MSATAEETEVLNRRRLVAELYLRGETQVSIAERLGVSQPTVSRDLVAIREEWKARAIEDFKAFIGDALAKIDRLELEYWTAWQSSVGEHTKRTEKLAAADASTGAGSPGAVSLPTIVSIVPIEVTVVTEKLAGDPRFLDGINRCIERRCRLLGLDAPQRTDITSGGKSVVYIDRQLGESV